MTAAIENKIEPQQIILNGLAKGMDEVSRLFDIGKMFLPQIVAASKTLDCGMAILHSSYPQAESDTVRDTIVMGTVAGDIHEIGKNVCCAMLRAARYNVVDLGSDVQPDAFLESAERYSASAIGGSSLMTTTLVSQRRIVETFNLNGCKALKLFGGAPCSREWVCEIKGDGYSSSGCEMVKLVDMLLSKNDVSTEPDTAPDEKIRKNLSQHVTV